MGEKQRKIIGKQVFGEDGIAKSGDITTFEHRVEVFAKKWAKEEQLINYMENTMLPKIKEYVLEPAWTEGTPMDWTNNNAEAANHVMKVAVDWKQQQIQVLINTLAKLLNHQHTEIERALVGKGDLILQPNYQHYYIPPQSWADKTSEDKEKIVDTFIKKRCPKAPKTITSTDGTFTMTHTPTAGKKQNQVRRRRAEKSRIKLHL